MKHLPLQINPRDPLPIYRQIVNQVSYLVAAGRLTPGDEISPIRVLAEQLLINPNTVARAYRELELAGIVFKRPGAGTYVSDQATPLRRKERKKILKEKLATLIAEYKQLGFTAEEVATQLRKLDKRIAKTQAREEGGED